MKTLLITGGTGYLGQRLLPIAADQATVVAGARNPRALSRLYRPTALDLCDEASIRRIVATVKPDAIIHAAAINPGVDDDLMEQVNHQGTRCLAEAANEHNSRLVLVSTDMVHNGTQAPYADEAIAQPINDYGLTKAAGEQAALSIHSNAIAVRTSLIYGLEAIDHGTEGFAKRLSQGECLTLFSDVLRQPVWRDALAISLVRLALELSEENGIVNVAGSDLLDRATFGEMMLDFWQIPLKDNSIQRILAFERTDLSSVPINTELNLERAQSLGLPTPGLYNVLKGR